MTEITIISNPSTLVMEDLIEEYEKISQVYCELKENNEKSEQENFQLARNLELSKKREIYLCQELESLTESHERESTDIKHKYSLETNDLRTRLTNVIETNEELENVIDRLKKEMVSLELVTKAKEPCECGTVTDESVLSNSRFQYLEKLESDRLTMLQDMDDLKHKLMESIQCLARNENELENIRDCFECSQENLRSRNQELDEKNQIIDSLHEKMVELTAELAEYKSGNNEPSTFFIGCF